ncbi:glycosyltransferase [Lapillicoccus jejuensis]|uniref:D-inositol 3-phosphate glycosyltransferase n=1 Tax=Lapillicoccus jejuensis TaxID=402171 RepID=A0A542DW47_9MICO|nr:glycosyltransferase [Lapillicoccus jejuensis]TQJ07276.1 glycosyltransferase involved in cell wall biosynthesis [Lapillicoccus jejuensis]
MTADPTTGRPTAVVTSTIAMTVATFHRELLRQLADGGYDVLVVTSPGAELDDLRDTAGVRTAGIPMAREIAPRGDLVAARAWWSLLRRERPALVVCATPKASLLGCVVAAVARVPQRLYYCGGLRLEGERGGRRALLAATEWVTGRAATQVVVNSPSLAARAARLRLFRRSTLRRTAPASSHGVDTDHFAPRPPDAGLRERLGLAPDVPTLVLVGRLTHDKGIDALLRALARLEGRAVRAQLVVVGPQDEPDSAHYLDALTRCRTVVVPVDRVADVRPYLALADLHVLPSLREGFPNVVLEAGAMGVATVTTDATGCVDSVRPGVTGLVVPAGDGDALGDAIAELLADPARRAAMGAAARDWVTARFRPADVVASLLGDLVPAPGPTSPVRSR